MTGREELKDPLGWIIAGTAGGVAWAILAGALGELAIIVGVGVAAVVLSTKVALGVNARNRPVEIGRAHLPNPPRDSPQAQLLARAEVAFGRLAQLADRPGDDWLHARIGLVDDQAEEVVDFMRELAGRATVLQQSVAAARPDRLRDDAARLAMDVNQTQDPQLRAERERTLAAINAQSESIDRLISMNDTLLSRMHSAAVGLEGLATQAGEVVAMGSDSVAQERAEAVMGELTTELVTMREGLQDAASAARDVG
ncbi:MAG: hypothetical protein K0U64_06500 [Actinomycetia bacterium]|nr:hypothetical protein [Actinomycetes bacterium]